MQSEKDIDALNINIWTLCVCIRMLVLGRSWGCVLTAGPVIRPWTDNGVDQSSLGGPLRGLFMPFTSVHYVCVELIR